MAAEQRHRRSGPRPDARGGAGADRPDRCSGASRRPQAMRRRRMAHAGRAPADRLIPWLSTAEQPHEVTRRAHALLHAGAPAPRGRPGAPVYTTAPAANRTPGYGEGGPSSLSRHARHPASGPGEGRERSPSNKGRTKRIGSGAEDARQLNPTTNSHVSNSRH
jgi:hypothetical protein